MRARLLALRLLPEISRGLTLLLGLTVLIGALLPVAFSVNTAILVGAVPETLRSGLSSPQGKLLQIALVLAGVLFVAQQAIGPLTGAVGATLGRRLSARLREKTMTTTFEPGGIGHLEDSKILDQVSLARGVGPAFLNPAGAVPALATLFGIYLQAIIFHVILATFIWWLGLLLFLVRILVRHRGRRHFLEMMKVYSHESQEMRKSYYFRDLALRPEAGKETRVFQMADWILARFSDYWDVVMKQIWELRRGIMRGRIFPMMVSVWPLFLLTFVLIARTGVAQEISLGQVTLYSLAFFGGAVVGQLGNHDTQLEYGLATIPAIEKLGHIVEPAALKGGSGDPSGLPKVGVEFQDVWFRYPGDRTAWIFEGLDIVIPAGRSLAIVGKNGAGKTTLIKLLSRFYDPQRGRILVDGVDIKEFSPEEWQKRVAAIFQDFVRYELAARENIGFGHLAFLNDEEELERAAEIAGASSIIDSLPKRWDTILSRRYTGGADLSGGQWQRVALARAMLAAHGNPGLLVLDEPTANLDVRGEAEIYERFLDLTKDQTTIVISHRFSTVRRVDRICVIESGKVVEVGSHDDLMRGDALYARMFRLQAARFVEEEQMALGTDHE